MTARRRSHAKPKKPRRPSKAEREAAARAALRLVDHDRRRARIESLLSQQYSTQQIVRMIATEFKITERTAYSDIAAVYASVQAESADDSAIRIGRARRTWQRLMRDAEEHDDRAAANYAHDRLCKLDGLYAPKRVEMSGSVGLSVSVSMRSIIGVLDATGLAALEIIMQQVEAAKARGELPTGDATDEGTHDRTPIEEHHQ